MKKKIGLIILVVFIVLLVSRDYIIKQVIVSVGSSSVGASVKVDSFSMSLIKSQVHMKGVKLHNPSGFSDNPLIDIAHVYVHYSPMDLIKGKMYFSLIDLNVHQLAVERNKEGKYNVASLKVAPKEASKASDKPAETGTAKPLDMRIDTLKLNVDEVTFRDNFKGQAKETKKGVGLKNKEFKNITSPQQLSALVLFEASGLSNLKNLAADTTKRVLGELTDVSGQAGKSVNSVVDSFKSIIKK